MTPAARLAAAMELLDEIQASPKPADQISSLYFKSRRYIGSKDRRAVAETVWRVLRTKARIDWWLEALDFPADARARVLVDMVFQGVKPEPELFQGAHSASPPNQEERRLLDTLRGKSPFHHAMPAWVKGEFPQWLEPRLTALWGERLAQEVGAMRDEAPLDLRVNTLKATRDDALIALKKERITATPTEISPLGLRLANRVALVQVQAWRDGLIEVQDEGSQLVALLADAQPGMAVVDYCAGAGGKTLALAAAMQNKGRLVACDVAEWRVDKAQARLRRAGVHNVTRRVIEGESDKWIKRSAASFDRVLVDAPCTGTGTWRRNPDGKWQLTEQTVLELVGRQQVILASAARLTKPGGRLIYATCSILPEENEEQIERFLSTHPEFTVVPVPGLWGELVGTPCPVSGPYLRLSPYGHGTDGFFAAVLERALAAVPE
ncbi:RsmB/NOP family class I SAM-dependent RNA methyltransferase [Magnetospirillum sulfuroxidans]|uniref:RsmB/NOP family class I SAM-dependent RNA methyltransferase n=1 Tax=Magnetospirillum sulfuroxidans TaxID=611300 RepID=A0ABS5IAH5_9PROT|nr:RsmB/NOP family class I SAM-dependent RNA methyltransferase [Magnetospirillum sulfuroxidans]MBR9971172.1 RsmB/NOP family class I SAM-dependent RNA methyltransferase [Magnetospirillum sulfuroxidans]